MQDVVTKFEQYKEAFRALTPNASLSLIKVAFLRDFLTGRDTIGAMEVAEVIKTKWHDSLGSFEKCLADEKAYRERDPKRHDKMLNNRIEDILLTAGWMTVDVSRCLLELAALALPSADNRNEKCELAVCNYLRIHVCEGGAAGLSPLHQEIEALGYTRNDVAFALFFLQREGKVAIEYGTVRLIDAMNTTRPASIAEWQRRVFDLNVSKGWYDKPGLSEKAAAILARLPADDVSELLKHMPTADGKRLAQSQEDVATFDANLSGEIAELWEAFRAGTLDKPCDKTDAMRAVGLPMLTCKEEEMADIGIRLFDQAEFWGVNLERAMWIKHLYNMTRAHRHGGKLA